MQATQQQREACALCLGCCFGYSCMTRALSRQEVSISSFVELVPESASSSDEPQVHGRPCTGLDAVHVPSALWSELRMLLLCLLNR